MSSEEGGRYVQPSLWRAPEIGECQRAELRPSTAKEEIVGYRSEKVPATLLNISYSKILRSY